MSNVPNMNRYLLLVGAFVLFATLPVALSISCPHGTFIKHGRCIKCPIGTYQESVNSTSCEDCPSGYYNPFKGGRRSENCLKCLVGTFSKSGASRCTPCPRGTFSLSSYPKCLTCRPGRALVPYAPECEKCRPGWYRPAGVPPTRCLLCPSGTGSRAGATKCKPCAKGTFRDTQFIGLTGVTSQKDCRKCPRNTFADVTGSVQCKLCPLGTRATEEGSIKCESCPAGTFRGLIRQKRCKRCPKGTTSLGKQPAACKHPTKGCPVNTFEDRHGECRACMPGERLDSERKKCVPCGPRQVSLGGVTKECKTCPPGQRPASANTIFEKSRCECKPGTVRNGAGGCKICPAGTHWDNRPPGPTWFASIRTSYYVEARCEYCNKGLFADKSGMTECKPCPSGTYANIKGSTMCRRCPDGFVSEATNPLEEFAQFGSRRQNCLSERTACEIGEVFDANHCVQRQCLPGTARMGNYCDPCFSTDRFYVPEKMDCERCPRGETNPPGAFRKCKICPKGAVGDEGRCLCLGEYGDDGNGGCKRCREGELSTAGACGPCPENSFYKMTKNGPMCKKCTGNTIKLKPSHRRCTKCRPGFEKERDVFGKEANRCVPKDLYPVH